MADGELADDELAVGRHHGVEIGGLGKVIDSFGVGVEFGVDGERHGAGLFVVDRGGDVDGEAVGINAATLARHWPHCPSRL